MRFWGVAPAATRPHQRLRTWIQKPHELGAITRVLIVFRRSDANGCSSP